MRMKPTVSITLDQRVLEKLDDARGPYPRSTMVNAILEDALGLADEQNIDGMD